MKPSHKTEEFWHKQLGEEWSNLLSAILQDPYMDKLMLKLEEEYARTQVYPTKKQVFRAFRETPPSSLRVVLLGQDPYHDGNATGLAFDCGVSQSPSMKSILQAYEDCYPDHFNTDLMDGKLHQWANEGVLLLNTALTVVARNPGSHTKYWNKFIKATLTTISENMPGVIFLLWGNYAKSYKPLLGNCRVLEATHPAAAQYNKESWVCDHFLKVNEYLLASNGPDFIINW
jgi:uracil-DNA glycosylase